MQTIGFGDEQAHFRVYLAAPPKMDVYQQLTGIQPLRSGDIDQIYRHCGNGWRKIFNVYAKLLLAWSPTDICYPQAAASWQLFRDQHLLQQHSNSALLFSTPIFQQGAPTIHLIAGRTLAKQLLAQGLPAELHWLSAEFAVDPNRQLLVTPFFDYRQLNNEKIALTAALLQLLARQEMDLRLYADKVQHGNALPHLI